MTSKQLDKAQPVKLTACNTYHTQSSTSRRRHRHHHCRRYAPTPLHPLPSPSFLAIAASVFVGGGWGPVLNKGSCLLLLKISGCNVCNTPDEGYSSIRQHQKKGVNQRQCYLPNLLALEEPGRDVKNCAGSPDQMRSELMNACWLMKLAAFLGLH